MASASVLQFVNSSGTAGGCTHVFVVFSSARRPDGCAVGNALVLIDHIILVQTDVLRDEYVFRRNEKKK